MRIHFRVVILIAILVALAGLFTLLIEDFDTFEARTGLFDRIGTWIINGLVAIIGLLCALGAASVFFPRRWGPKSRHRRRDRLRAGSAVLPARAVARRGLIRWSASAPIKR